MESEGIDTIIKTLKPRTMRYKIGRVCWTEKTYNGYSDNPYWIIALDGYVNLFGLDDDGKLWVIHNDSNIITHNIIESVKTIIVECKLNITLKE